jgi:hypothetical protein
MQLTHYKYLLVSHPDTYQLLGPIVSYNRAIPINTNDPEEIYLSYYLGIILR